MSTSTDYDTSVLTTTSPTSNSTSRRHSSLDRSASAASSAPSFTRSRRKSTTSLPTAPSSRRSSNDHRRRGETTSKISKSSYPPKSLAQSFNTLRRHLREDTFDSSWGNSTKGRSNYHSLWRDIGTIDEAYSWAFGTSVPEQTQSCANHPDSAIANLREKWDLSSSAPSTSKKQAKYFDSNTDFKTDLVFVRELRNALAPSREEHQRQAKERRLARRKQRSAAESGTRTRASDTEG